MPEGKGYPDASQLMQRVQAAMRFRKKHEDRWQLCMDLYRGTHNYVGLSGLDQGVHFQGRSLAGWSQRVNQVTALVDTIYTMSAVNAPKIDVFPRHSSDKEAAALASSLANYWWRAYRAHPIFKEALKTSIIIGHAWVKVLWKEKYGTRAWTEEEIRERVDEEILALDRAMEGLDDAALETMATPEEIEKQVRADAKANPHNAYETHFPKVVQVSPWEMFIDPTALHFNEAKWVCERVWKPYDEAKNNKAWKKSSRDKLAIASSGTQFSEHNNGTEMGSRLQEGMSELDYVVPIYEYHDLEDGWWCEFHQNSDEFLREPQPTNLENTPYRGVYEQIRNKETGDLYPQGDVIQIAGLQTQLNETFTQMLANIQQMNPKYIVRRGHDDDTLRESLKSNAPNQISFVDLLPNQLFILCLLEEL